MFLSLVAILALSAFALLTGCGSDDAQKDWDDIDAAVTSYCEKNGIDIPDFSCNNDDDRRMNGQFSYFSSEDNDWLAAYALPRDAEDGAYFLLHKGEQGWEAVADLWDADRTGWLVDEMHQFRAPADLAKCFDTPQEAVQWYVNVKGIDMSDVRISGEDGFGDKPTVSTEDPAWEIVYAFPAEAEGDGDFFLMRETDGGWQVMATTAGSDATGWTAAELERLGAPTDLATTN